MKTSTESGRAGRTAGLLVALLALAAACVAWWPLLDLALLGWDTYPLIVAGKVSSASELLGTFGEELMDGRYPLGHFWRPVTHLSFALDHALWGLDPFGYHLTDLVLVAATAALVSALVGRLFGGSGRARWIAGLVAGLVYAWHPVHFEVLTAPPRRADALAVCFTIWALFLHARDPLTPSLPRRVGVALLCALALASKEAGIVALVVVVLASLCAPRPAGQLGGQLATRALQTLRATWPALVSVGAALALRTSVLGGLGGSEHSSPTAGLANAWPLVLEYARGVLVPANVFPAAGAPGSSVSLWPLGVLLIVTALASQLSSSAAEQEPGPRGGALFLGLWALALLAITGMSGIVQGWYALPFVAVFGLALGLVVSRSLTHLGARPALAIPGLALALAGLGVSLAGSGFFDRAEDFRAVSALQTEFLARFESRIKNTPGDQTIQLQGCPAEIYVTRGEVLERMIFALGPYSLEAYAELTLPGRYVRVSYPGFESQLPRRSGEVRVGVVPAPLRFDR